MYWPASIGEVAKIMFQEEYNKIKILMFLFYDRISWIVKVTFQFRVNYWKKKIVLVQIRFFKKLLFLTYHNMADELFIRCSVWQKKLRKNKPWKTLKSD